MKNYFGAETKKALRNFPFSTHPVKMEFILSLVKIKKAAALANAASGKLSLSVGRAIAKACDEVLSGKLAGQFPLSGFQGGAGTAVNMNLNEVLAARATELLDGKIQVHPNDQVNWGQSTNDVNPSALRLAVYGSLTELDAVISQLIKSFQKRAREFAGLPKLGRTHLQDAVPTTLGAEFVAYGVNLAERQKSLRQVRETMLVLNLGGTAIGNSINAGPKYRVQVYRYLNRLTRARFRPASNLMAKTSSHADFLAVSQALTVFCVELSKIANDFKLMSSGPAGGLGELVLPELQNGSSIMPGKVNPVMPETVNQLYFLVSGNNLAIEQAVEASQLELGVMLPVIADRLLESLRLAREVIGQFDRLCVAQLKANAKKCSEHLENSTALATYLTPKFGYDRISQLVKETVSKRTDFKREVLAAGLMAEKEWQAFVQQVIRSLK